MNGVAIRHCRYADLAALEWDGTFADLGWLFTRIFELAEHGAMAMLVAERAGEHLGQVWIDLSRFTDVAFLWALRVKPAWRGRGVGRQLIAAAERIARRRRRTQVMIEAERDNPHAAALYEHLGYRWMGRGHPIDALGGGVLAFEVDTFRRVLRQVPAGEARDL